MEVDRGARSRPSVDRVIVDVAAPLETRPAINSILGGSSDDQYQLKRQQRKLFRAAMVKARVNAIHTRGSREETKSIDNPISFPLINPNRVIVPHYDALVLTLFISSFDVHMVLVDPGSTIDLLQLPAFNQMKLSSRMQLSRVNTLWFQRCNDHDTRRHHAPCTSRTSHPTGFILNHRRLRAL